jgi:hypothetical protein
VSAGDRRKHRGRGRNRRTRAGRVLAVDTGSSGRTWHHTDAADQIEPGGAPQTTGSDGPSLLLAVLTSSGGGSRALHRHPPVGVGSRRDFFSPDLCLHSAPWGSTDRGSQGNSI